MRLEIIAGCALLVASTACGGAKDVSESTASREAPQDPACDDSDDSGGFQAICAQDGVLDIAVGGTGFDAYEGATVYASAIQPVGIGVEMEREVVALLAGTIEKGSFSVACLDSLDENFAYPSYAILIDVNGNGGCDKEDLVHEALLYGWAYDIDDSLTPADGWTTADGTTWGGASVCSYYHFPIAP